MFTATTAPGPGKPFVPPLPPGETHNVCYFGAGGNARAVGRVAVVVTGTCIKNVETNCADNTARGKIVVKR